MLAPITSVRGKISGETEERDIMQPVVGWESNRG